MFSYSRRLLREERSQRHVSSGSDVTKIPERLCLRDFFIRIFIFGTSYSPKSQPNAAPQNDHTQDQTTEVADKVTDQFPLTAKEIAKTSIQDNPGEFSKRVISHKSPESDSAPAGDQIGGKGQGGDQEKREIDCQPGARVKGCLCIFPHR